MAAMRSLRRRKSASSSYPLSAPDAGPPPPMEITEIPASCLPGGADADAYQSAFEALLGADSDDDREAALAELRQLGVSDRQIAV